MTAHPRATGPDTPPPLGHLPGHAVAHPTPAMAGPDAIGPESPPTTGNDPGTGPDLAVGIGVIGLGGLLVWQTLSVPQSPTYAVVGPTLVPWLVSALMLALGVGRCAAAVRGGWSRDLEEVREAPPANWRALGLLAAALVMQVALIEWLGFVIASTILYVIVCAAFGSRRPLRDLGIGVAVTVVAYLAFDRLLGVNIGAGILEGVL